MAVGLSFPLARIIKGKRVGHARLATGTGVQCDVTGVDCTVHSMQLEDMNRMWLL